MSSKKNIFKFDDRVDNKLLRDIGILALYITQI